MGGGLWKGSIKESTVVVKIIVLHTENVTDWQPRGSAASRKLSLWY